MKYLIIDDTPEYLKPLKSAIFEAGNEPVFARDIGTPWRWLQRGDHFGLIVIDLALDRTISEFEAEQRVIREGLALRDFGDLPMSGQALGMRLWSQRQTLRQPYCYITNHRQLWLPKLGSKPPEFGDTSPDDLNKLLIDKSSLWPNNVNEKFNDVLAVWGAKKWLN
jgi:hypothetical protein